tara:strand:- start:468 stop:998 length:531 start_codon:yes stop_codon:yes gene_type:complete
MKKTLLIERFQQLAGIKPLYTLSEALNKPMIEFGKDLQKRLDGVGFDSKLFNNKGSVPDNVRQTIAKNAKLAGISYLKIPKEGIDYEIIEVVVHKDKLKELEKVVGYFQTADGTHGPDKDTGWLIKNVQNTNPGDIINSKVVANQLIATVTYFTNMGDRKNIISKDKTTGKSDQFS